MSEFGSKIIHFDAVTSTNDVARSFAQQGEEEGAVIVARLQSAGRGRSGRTWSSAQGEGLYLSIILRPQVNPHQSTIIPLAAAVAVAETIKKIYGIRPDIKWPNDVLIRGRKVSGVLVESAIEGSRIQFAILGIGVNTGQRRFPDELVDTATSILLETGIEHSPEEMIKPLLERADLLYRKALADPEEVISRWEELSSYARDRRVKVISSGEEIEGITRGLTPGGGLLIELGSGERREVVSGEVSLRSADISKTSE